MKSPPADVLDELTKKHEEIFIFEKGGHAFVLRRAAALSYRKWIGRRGKGPEHAYDADEELARQCVLWPEPEPLGVLFDRFPGLVTEIAGEVVAIAHASEKSEAKKFEPSSRGPSST
jgi:hypothetical protein